MSAPSEPPAVPPSTEGVAPESAELDRLPLEHALNIDFVNGAGGPGARVAVELSAEAARALVRTIEAVLAEADRRGVLEDRPLA